MPAGFSRSIFFSIFRDFKKKQPQFLLIPDFALKFDLVFSFILMVCHVVDYYRRNVRQLVHVVYVVANLTKLPL